MKIPEFKHRREFLEGIDAPCLMAKVKNSELPGVARRHIAKHRKDPVCDILIRPKTPKVMGEWSGGMLKRLLENEELPAVLEGGMKEFEAGSPWPGYFKESRIYAEIQEHGIVPHLTVAKIVIDEIREEAILVCGTEFDVNLSEHGIAMAFSKGQWHFHYEDYLEDYISDIQEEEGRKRWEMARPSGCASDPNATDTAFIAGTWRFDENESRAMMERMKASKREIQELMTNCGGTEYRITSGTFLHTGPLPGQRWEFAWIGCDRRGDKVVLKFRRPNRDELITREMYYCNGLLMDTAGLVLKKI